MGTRKSFYGIITLYESSVEIIVPMDAFIGIHTKKMGMVDNIAIIIKLLHANLQANPAII